MFLQDIQHTYYHSIREHYQDTIDICLSLYPNIDFINSWMKHMYLWMNSMIEDISKLHMIRFECMDYLQGIHI